MGLLGSIEMPIKSKAAKDLFDEFLLNRGINKAFYSNLGEESYGFRMVDTNDRRSDTPRESLKHIITVSRNYIHGCEEGEIKFDETYDDLERSETKEDLLALLDENSDSFEAFLSERDIDTKSVKVPWMDDPILAVEALYGINSHEILHQGWNLAIMDHLNMPRFKELKEMWG